MEPCDFFSLMLQFKLMKPWSIGFFFTLQLTHKTMEHLFSLQFRLVKEHFFYANSLGSCGNGALWIFFLLQLQFRLVKLWSVCLLYSLGSWRSVFFCANSLGSCSNGALWIFFLLQLQFRLVKLWSVRLLYSLGSWRSVFLGANSLGSCSNGA